MVERETIFRVFPSSDVSLRAAAAFKQTKKLGAVNYHCLIVLLQPEEEAAAYQTILLSTLPKIIEVEGDTQSQLRQYRHILIGMSQDIKRRGGSRDQSICPFLYERHGTEGAMTSYCRVVKKPCYTTTYRMPGFPRCPRYIRKQRRTQLANARRLVRAGIQRILAKAEQESQNWSEPIRAILNHIFEFLPISQDAKELAQGLTDTISEKHMFQGVPRPIIAASIAYISAKNVGDKLDENDIIELVGCSRVSLRRNCRELALLLPRRRIKISKRVGKQSEAT